MTAAICRPATALLFAIAFLAASPTHADNGDPTSTLYKRLDVPVARAIDMFFSAADTQSLTMRGLGHVRHVVDLAAFRVWPSERLALRMGVGRANLIDSPVACAAKTSGTALSGSI